MRGDDYFPLTGVDGLRTYRPRVHWGWRAGWLTRLVDGWHTWRAGR